LKDHFVKWVFLGVPKVWGFSDIPFF